MYQDFLIVVPAYNEEKNIAKLLSKLVPKFKNILVVDNNSQDKTVEEVEKFPVFCAKHKYNLGKSLSMKTGMNFALIKKKKYVAYLDADGQHKVQDLEKICFMVKKKNYDAVLGYRKNLNNLNVKKKHGTRLLEFFFSFLYKKSIKDIQSGLRVINTKISKKIDWTSSGITHYFADAEITCLLCLRKCKIAQLPIDTIASEKYKGMNLLQGLLLLTMLLVWRFR
ncbi:glycosyltransferase involved in cell wall biogenesis [Candidatus Pelagibacter sp. IMCC9063]|uniref:glycosyltransferase family 2 protein n=1 Tax=Pelagibacter sp. (strain IMCC9063) TaxID=1002672 RepID=UPI0002046445|nr:glycosyltransferase family 2 protein [Candidatus Pelagibacter sp. IMCC9063]AEA80518.1 glycosyltransferase involved in cell wall biogenesis [Candidatus Pelagibacter sp. IMCC9063]